MGRNIFYFKQYSLCTTLTLLQVHKNRFWYSIKNVNVIDKPSHYCTVSFPDNEARAAFVLANDRAAKLDCSSAFAHFQLEEENWNLQPVYQN